MNNEIERYYYEVFRSIFQYRTFTRHTDEPKSFDESFYYLFCVRDNRFVYNLLYTLIGVYNSEKESSIKLTSIVSRGIHLPYIYI